MSLFKTIQTFKLMLTDFSDLISHLEATGRMDFDFTIGLTDYYLGNLDGPNPDIFIANLFFSTYFFNRNQEIILHMNNFLRRDEEGTKRERLHGGELSALRSAYKVLIREIVILEKILPKPTDSTSDGEVVNRIPNLLPRFYWLLARVREELDYQK